ncbi:MAG: hypothetical protein A2284_06650 [Deltaproteobacteria bacterium RIFOXYA12_FULL_61_11]|nr:MAG: hypothetical protein A2284_06650 [Deltaproteobacteria bacterium RIFOXYA12_FULL_61_11]
MRRLLFLVLILCGCPRDPAPPNAQRSAKAAAVQTVPSVEVLPAPVATLSAVQEGQDLVVTLTGLLSEDCNGLSMTAKAGVEARKEYERRGELVRLYVWQYRDAEEECTVTSPHWEKQIRIPDLPPGTWRLVANEGAAEVTLLHHQR